MIAVLDFGGQYAHLIARRFRDLHVSVRLFAHDVDASELADVTGVVFSGGPTSVYAENAPTPKPAIFELGVPILGLCYGHQFLARHFGGEVKSASKEYGEKTIDVLSAEGVLDGVAGKQKVWFSHGDTVLSVPAGF
ncbi:MAG: GMP synthase (glutamine-hydrolyzing), partial [Candidatus Micrarchaeota archaeon]|nr:GMP synthase (glutamine-hydrolyzing) [Candidatus Micrarchaeota archaeon]